MKGYRLRAFIIGFIGLALSVYSLCNGQAEWVIGTNGPFSKPLKMRFHAYLLPPSRKVVVGLGTLPSIMNLTIWSLLLLGICTCNALLLMPSVVHALSDLLKDISTDVITVYLVYSNLGTTPAVVYGLFNAAKLVLHTYLWLGVLGLYEEWSTKKSTIEPPKRQIRHRRNTILNDFGAKYSTSVKKFSFAIEEAEKRIFDELEEFKKAENSKYLPKSVNSTITDTDENILQNDDS